ncbi:MAG: GNAT family N-acetyltransferase [Alphaproteobacteria bacterium]|nr:MAG: GNAT family N-acetyltransferase [Alphaproteobacteria bacterium]
MGFFARGRYVARLAETQADVEAAQRLRFQTFIEGRDAAVHGPRARGLDADHLDEICDHMLVEDRRTGRLACCFRMLPMETGAEIDRSYSAQYYDLSALREYPHKIMEMGRFCVHPDFRDAELLRVAWGAMTRYVDSGKVELLIGCSSFEGTEAEAYMDAFALLKERHLAPKRWLPRVKAPRVFPFARRLRLRRPDMKKALRAMPPLLRTYLAMGGWVSDHAVVDRDLNTLHVFTGVEIRRVPKARARSLRAT